SVAGVLIRDGLSEFVPFNNGDARVRSQAIKVGSAAPTRVCDVRQVSVCDGSVGGGTGRTVPRAILGSESGGAVPGRRRNDVLRGCIGRSRDTKVLRGIHRFRCELRLCRMRGSGKGVVVPGSYENSRWIASRGTRAIAGDGPPCHALAILC